MNGPLRASLAVFFWLLGAPALAQKINVPAQLSDEAALPGLMPKFAKAMIANLDSAPNADPESLLHAQLAAGLYGDAQRSLAALRAPLITSSSPRVRARYLPYVLYARSAQQAAEAKISIQTAYRDAFHAVISPLDDRTAAIAVNGLSFDNLTQANQALELDLKQLKGRGAISLPEGVKLLRDFNEREMVRVFASTSTELIAEDDAHRYVIEKDVAVPTSDGATVCALIVRPTGSARLPALLLFTIYNDSAAIFHEARRAASNRYAGVIGLTRGKGCSTGDIVPYEHDGTDAAALIAWIARKPWCDGQVGMYGGSYSGFTAWAAAKHQPPALKAIMVGAPNAPAIDSPMEGNVFWNFIYPWPLYTTNNKFLDVATYSDAARWERLDRNWYLSGRPYRDLEKIDAQPNPIFDRWIGHPSYDAYWQSMLPYKEEFARISIAVLETAGYYYGGPGAAVYYFSQHYKYKPDAQHYLLIGPYDHFMAQHGTANAQGDVDSLAGYSFDPTAKIDLDELRFQWFDHVLKGGPRPSILVDKVNYQVTGANEWKHVPSLAAMANGSARYYLSAEPSQGARRLTTAQPAQGSTRLTVNLAERSESDLQSPGGGVQDPQLDSRNGLVFVSEPLLDSVEMSGLFSGHLDFIVNRRDFDFQVALFELTAAHDYIQLAPYWSRASHVEDLSQRRLFSPGQRQTLNFRSMRLMSRLLKPGSRLVVVLSIIKERGREINYGTGRTVSEESIADAAAPLEIEWFASSYIEMPTYR